MRRTVVVLTAVVLMTVSACTSGTEPDPVPAASRSVVGTPSASASASVDDGSVTVETAYLTVPLEITVAPVQVKDDVALLTVEYRLGEGAVAGASFAAGQALKTATGAMGPTAVRLVDLERATVFVPGLDEKEQPAVTRDGLLVSAGKPATSESFFAAPAGDTVSVLFPYVGLVRDVPVVRLGAAEQLPTSPQEQGREGVITYGSAPIDAFTVGFDDSTSTRVTADEVTVSLASDVLFGVDESALTPEAQAVIDAAGAEIKAQGAEGEVLVIGHTDDVASDEYNQTLSVARAQAVVDRLAPTLGSGFAVTAEGRGESEPTVPGTSDDARAANRRVEIQFTTRTVGASVEVGTGATVPEATGPVASGSASVVPTGIDGFSVRATSVVRVGAYLVGSLEVTREGSGPDYAAGLFGDITQGRAASRGLTAFTMTAGVHNATLLGTSSRYYPADYLRTDSDGGTDLRSVVADQWIGAQFMSGDSVTVTVLWPDPGGDTVTIDVPARFRLTDVPVQTP